jgi:2-dehydro-3-deoxygalactonokinase
MESAIAADDLKIFDEAQELGFDLNTDFIIVGNKGRSRIYEALIKEKVNNQKKIISVCEKKDIEMLAVRGAIEIVKGNIHVSQLAMV